MAKLWTEKKKQKKKLFLTFDPDATDLGLEFAKLRHG